MSAGKGSAPRNLGPKFRENFDAIFKKSRADGRGVKASKPNSLEPKPLEPSRRTVSPHP